MALGLNLGRQLDQREPLELPQAILLDVEEYVGGLAHTPGLALELLDASIVAGVPGAVVRALHLTGIVAKARVSAVLCDAVQSVRGVAQRAWVTGVLRVLGQVQNFRNVNRGRNFLVFR